jgi:hypothetical protein
MAPIADWSFAQTMARGSDTPLVTSLSIARTLYAAW